MGKIQNTRKSLPCRIAVATVTGVAVVAMAVPGGAAPQADPQNKNFEAFAVVCDGEPTSVVVSKRNESVVAFDEQGRPLVLQKFEGVVEATFEIRDAGGNVLETGSVAAKFEETYGQRKGTQGRTMACTFSDTFTEESHVLTAEDAAFLDDPNNEATPPENAESYEAYVGQFLFAEGTFFGTAHVMTPGRK